MLSIDRTLDTLSNTRVESLSMTDQPDMQQSDHSEHRQPATYQDVATQGASLIDRFMGARNARANKEYQTRNRPSS